MLKAIDSSGGSSGGTSSRGSRSLLNCNTDIGETRWERGREERERVKERERERAEEMEEVMVMVKKKKGRNCLRQQSTKKV